MQSALAMVLSRCAITTRVALSRSRLAADEGLVGIVQRAGGLVQEEHARLADKGAGDQQPLPLPARQVPPPSLTTVCIPIGICSMS